MWTSENALPAKADRAPTSSAVIGSPPCTASLSFVSNCYSFPNAPNFVPEILPPEALKSLCTAPLAGAGSEYFWDKVGAGA